jgi:hypothetical protein
MYRRCSAATDRWLGRFLDGWLLRDEDGTETAPS